MAKNKKAPKKAAPKKKVSKKAAPKVAAPVVTEAKKPEPKKLRELSEVEKKSARRIYEEARKMDLPISMESLENHIAQGGIISACIKALT